MGTGEERWSRGLEVSWVDLKRGDKIGLTI